MNAQEFIASIDGTDRPQFQRLGQWAFNRLLEIRPDLAEAVRGGPFDPFYQDKRLGVFEDFLRTAWELTPVPAPTTRGDGIEAMKPVAYPLIEYGDEGIKPSVSYDGPRNAPIPRCAHEDCGQYDGKRCRILGCRPGSICEPAVEMLLRVIAHEARQ